MQSRNNDHVNFRESENPEQKKGMNVQSVLQRPMNPNDKTRECCKKNSTENMKDNNVKPEA